MLQAEIDEALKVFQATAGGLPTLIYSILLAASDKRGDVPPVASTDEVTYIVNNMPQLVANQSPIVAYTALITNILALAEYARANVALVETANAAVAAAAALVAAEDAEAAAEQVAEEESGN